MLTPLLLHVSILGLAAASALGLFATRRESPSMLGSARILAIVATLLVLALQLRRGMEFGGLPLVSRFDTLLMVAVLIVGAALSIDLTRGLSVLMIGALPVALAPLLFAAAIGMPDEHPERNLMHPAVGVHVFLTLGAYAVFGVAFVASILYLIEHRQLKARTGPSLLGMMPSLETSYRLTLRALAAGLVLLTAGIVLGYLYGRQVLSGASWRLDAKVWLTTVSWIFYVIVFGMSFVPAFKGRRTALASVACFVIVMATSWVASFWSHFHRYP
ncbi:MAG: cytochrome c biogenesis protein CcsA [Planctomycetes bacterium]|nr:cytochrome c biogenesis protein CcsA [Planctomycetota bacterium]